MYVFISIMVKTTILFYFIYFYNLHTQPFYLPSFRFSLLCLFREELYIYWYEILRYYSISFHGIKVRFFFFNIPISELSKEWSFCVHLWETLTWVNYQYLLCFCAFNRYYQFVIVSFFFIMYFVCCCKTELNLYIFFCYLW